jgi:tetratricopeptide (TPR) repeat protein
VRQYALERLAEAGEEAATRDRHLAFYVALSERAGRELSGPKQKTWHQRLDPEHENILLAFAHGRHAPGGGAAGLTMVHGLHLWFTLHDIVLWRGVVSRALAHPDAQQEDVARSRALYHAAFLTYRIGSHGEAFALAESGVRIARACGDPQALAEALLLLGVTAIGVDRGADAYEHFVEGLALARQVDDRITVAYLAHGMGELLSQQDQLELAEPAYLEALAGYRDDPVNAAVVLSNLARIAIALRAEDKAVQYLREMVTIAGRKYTGPLVDALLWNCAGLAALRGEWPLALRLDGAAASHLEQCGLRGDFVDARFHASSMAPVRAALGALAADAAFAAGRAMNVDAALREAEAWLDALPAA